MFGNPGTVEQGFLDALSDYPELDYILALQETVAVGDRRRLRPRHRQPDAGAAAQRRRARQRHRHALPGQARPRPLVVLAGEAGVRYDAMDAQMAADLVAWPRR